MKKIFSSIILSALVIGMFLKPISVFAYSNDLNNYVDTDITVEEAKDYVAKTIIAYGLAAGAELVVPGSGATVAEITDKVWDAIDWTNDLYDWAVNTYRKAQDGYWPWENVSYGLSPTNNKSPIDYAWEELKNRWDNSSNEIETYPETNYLPYIDLINGKTFNYSAFQTDNWFTTISNAGLSNFYSFIKTKDSVSYFNRVNHSFNPNQYNSSGYSSYYIANMTNGYTYHLNTCYTLEPVSIYINYNNNIYQCTTSSLVNTAILKNNDNFYYYAFEVEYNKNNNSISYLSPQSSSPNNNLSWYYSNASLENCFKMISMLWRNVNIYVDGIPWSIITQPPDPIQLGGNTYITDTNTPVYYDFPDGTRFDPNAFAAIMRQLIDLNNTGNAITIQIDDILDSFTDEYGHTAQYVVNIVRNDYDNLLYEQYGNKQVRVQFPEELKPYSEKVTYVMNNFGDDLIPQDLLTIICCGGILLLIGFLINRMLE